MTDTMQLTFVRAKHGGLCIWDASGDNPVFAGDQTQVLKYIGERTSELLKEGAAENDAPPVARAKPVRETREVRSRLLELEAAE